MNFDDELEEEVKPKAYEQVPKPLAPQPKKRQPVKIVLPNLADVRYISYLTVQVEISGTQV